MAGNMGNQQESLRLARPVQLYISLVCIVGMALLVHLLQGVEWSPSTLGEAGLFILLIVVAGNFTLPVAPKIKTDVTAAAFFSAALLLEPGIAALASAVGVLTYPVLIRFWAPRLQEPWYKYLFNAGATALFVGLASVVFHALTLGSEVVTLAVVPVAASFYLVNTFLVSIVVSLQLGVNPLRFWWIGTRENGLAEQSLFAFGFLGALAYQENPWTVVALFIPVAIIYIAFSRLARTNEQLGEANRTLEDTNKQLIDAQDQVVRTERLAAIGQLAGGVAHDLRNPLGAIKNPVYYLKKRLGTAEMAQSNLKIAQFLQIMEDQINNSNQIITDLLDFVRIQAPTLSATNLEEIIENAISSVEPRENVHIIKRFDPDLVEVLADGGQLQRVLINLTTNAQEAMPDGGELSISTQKAREFVEVAFSDTGLGIADEDIRKVFDPLFTTKTKGTGLGLAICQQILYKQGATIEVVSKLGEGTTFAVRLPSAKAKVTDADSSIGIAAQGITEDEEYELVGA